MALKVQPSEAFLSNNFCSVSQLLGISRVTKKSPKTTCSFPPPHFLHLLHCGYIIHNPMVLNGRTHDTMLMRGSYGLSMANFRVNFDSDEKLRSKNAPECSSANAIFQNIPGAEARPFSNCFHQPCKQLKKKVILV